MDLNRVLKNVEFDIFLLCLYVSAIIIEKGGYVWTKNIKHWWC
jgi:hypothetical protein